MRRDGEGGGRGGAGRSVRGGEVAERFAALEGNAGDGHHDERFRLPSLHVLAPANPSPSLPPSEEEKRRGVCGVDEGWMRVDMGG